MARVGLGFASLILTIIVLSLLQISVYAYNEFSVNDLAKDKYVEAEICGSHIIVTVYIYPGPVPPQLLDIDNKYMTIIIDELKNNLDQDSLDKYVIDVYLSVANVSSNELNLVVLVTSDAPEDFINNLGTTLDNIIENNDKFRDLYIIKINYINSDNLNKSREIDLDQLRQIFNKIKEENYKYHRYQNINVTREGVIIIFTSTTRTNLENMMDVDADIEFASELLNSSGLCGVPVYFMYLYGEIAGPGTDGSDIGDNTNNTDGSDSAGSLGSIDIGLAVLGVVAVAALSSVVLFRFK